MEEPIDLASSLTTGLYLESSKKKAEKEDLSLHFILIWFILNFGTSINPVQRGKDPTNAFRNTPTIKKSPQMPQKITR